LHAVCAGDLGSAVGRGIVDHDDFGGKFQLAERTLQHRQGSRQFVGLVPGRPITETSGSAGTADRVAADEAVSCRPSAVSQALGVSD